MRFAAQSKSSFKSIGPNVEDVFHHFFEKIAYFYKGTYHLFSLYVCNCFDIDVKVKEHSLQNPPNDDVMHNRKFRTVTLNYLFNKTLCKFDKLEHQ